MTAFLSKIKASEAEHIFQVELKKSVTQMTTTEYDGVVYIKAKDKAEAEAKMQEYIKGKDITTYQDEKCEDEAESIEFIDWDKDTSGYDDYDDGDAKTEFNIDGVYPL